VEATLTELTQFPNQAKPLKSVFSALNAVKSTPTITIFAENAALSLSGAMKPKFINGKFSENLTLKTYSRIASAH
jgi:hypothetical protein